MIAGSEAFSIPSTAAVVVVAAPAASTRRVPRFIQIFNPVGNGALDVLLRFNNGAITSFLTQLAIADGGKIRISGRAEDDAVTASKIDDVVEIALDTTGKTIEAVAQSNPASPLQVISSWGDYT